MVQDVCAMELKSGVRVCGKWKDVGGVRVCEE